MEEDELLDITSEYGKVLGSEIHREGAYKCAWAALLLETVWFKLARQAKYMLFEYGARKEAEAAVHELDERRMDDWGMRIQAYLYPGDRP